MSDRSELVGRLVLDDRVVGGRLVLEDGLIAALDVDAAVMDGPYLVPGFVDVHVHGWGGHDAMGDPAALTGMARALARRGVTSFLPTAVSAPLPELAEFAERVRAWLPVAPGDGATPLGYNLEGPFLADARRGAHDPALLMDPADIPVGALDALLAGLRVITVAPELPGALDLIRELRGGGVAVSMGHSAASLEEARAGYAAGGSTTTHLFNGMTGLDHRAPGLAAAALLNDDVYVELIADGHHVHPGLWPLITRLKPGNRVLLVSDAIVLAGQGDGRARIGTLEVEVHGGRVTLVGTNTLAGSVIALDDAVRNLVTAGIPLPAAVAAASRNPSAMLGEADRGRLAVGLRADVVALDDALRVIDVWLAGRRLATSA